MSAAGYRAAELDLLRVIETVIARAPRMLKSGQPNLAFFRAANTALATPDDEAKGHGYSQVEFWLTLSLEQGLLQVQDDRLEPAAAADTFFALPLADRRAQMREAFLDSRALNDFAMIPELELPGLKRPSTVDVITDAPGVEARMEARRQALELALRSEPDTPTARLIAQVRHEAAHFVIDHTDDASWRRVHYRGIRLVGAREDIEREGNWERVEGAYLRWLIALPFSRLGWVSYDAARQTFTPLSDTEPEAHFELVVQPNFEILALGDRLDAATLYRVTRFTRPDVESPVRRYLLEKKPFTDALGRGATLPALLDTVAALSRNPVPQNVRFALDEWSASSERIKIWPDALLVECEGVENLSAMLPAAMQQSLGLAAINGGHMVAPAPDAATLRGTLPPRRAVLDYSRRLPPVIAPREGLRLHAPAETLHLRARQLLERIAQRESADYWVLDPARIHTAAASVGADELRRLVDEALSRPLEPQHALSLRGWSGEFAPPFAGQAEVFLCDSDAQAELMDTLPDFAAWVDRRLSRTAWLLRPGGAQQLRKLLTGIGMTLRDKPHRDA